MTQQNAAMVEETSSVATSMTEQASALKSLIALFKVEGVAEQARAPAAVIAMRQPQARPAPAPARLSARHASEQPRDRAHRIFPFDARLELTPR